MKSVIQQIYGLYNDSSIGSFWASDASEETTFKVLKLFGVWGDGGKTPPNGN